MKVRITENGMTVDAVDLGPLPGIAAADVPARMRAGEITNQSETGLDADACRITPTFRHDGQRVRLVYATDGTVLKISRAHVGRPPKGRRPL